MKVVTEVMELFGTAGRAAYFGEPVSQEEHALQCAHLADQQGADDSLVVAALLHDVGHLLHHQGEDIAEQGADAQHEVIGQAWLMRRFGSAVAEPVRLHVAAKQFLCATDPHYLAQLLCRLGQTVEQISNLAPHTVKGRRTASQKGQQNNARTRLDPGAAYVSLCAVVGRSFAEQVQIFVSRRLRRRFQFL